MSISEVVLSLLLSNFICFGLLCRFIRSTSKTNTGFTAVQTYGLVLNLALNSFVTFIVIKAAAILGIIHV